MYLVGKLWSRNNSLMTILMHAVQNRWYFSVHLTSLGSTYWSWLQSTSRPHRREYSKCIFAMWYIHVAAATNDHTFNYLNSPHLLSHSLCNSELLIKQRNSRLSAQVKMLAGLCCILEVLGLFPEFSSIHVVEGLFSVFSLALSLGLLLSPGGCPSSQAAGPLLHPPSQQMQLSAPHAWISDVLLLNVFLASLFCCISLRDTSVVLCCFYRLMWLTRSRIIFLLKVSWWVFFIRSPKSLPNST